MNAINNLIAKNAKKLVLFGGLGFAGFLFLSELFATFETFMLYSFISLLVNLGVMALIVLGVWKEKKEWYELGALLFIGMFFLASISNYIGCVENISGAFDYNWANGLCVLFNFFAGLGLVGILVVFFLGKFGKKLPSIVLSISALVALGFLALVTIFSLIYPIVANAEAGEWGPYYSFADVVSIFLSSIATLCAAGVLVGIVASENAPAEESDAE